MLLALLAAAAMAQTDAQTDTLAASVAADLTAPPKLNRARAILCRCAKATAPDVLLTGLVVDAELFLGEDKRSAADRQATIFNILSALENGEPMKVSGRTRIFHETNTNQCGVRFDYGKQYMVYARKNEDGGFETDYCLMNAAFDDTPTDDAASATDAEAPASKNE